MLEILSLKILNYQFLKCGPVLQIATADGERTDGHITRQAHGRQAARLRQEFPLPLSIGRRIYQQQSTHTQTDERTIDQQGDDNSP